VGRSNALVILLIVETLIVLMLSVSFYKLSQDDEYTCYFDDRVATVTTGETETPVEGSVIDEYIDWGEGSWCDLRSTAIVFDTEPQSTLSWEDGQLHFEGNVDEAAMEFIEIVIGNVNTICEEISNEQCEPYTDKFRKYLDYFGEHGSVKPDYNDDIPLWMDFISEYGDIYSPTVKKHYFVHWFSGKGWVFLSGEEYDSLSMYFMDVGRIPEGLSCSEFAPEGKPSNEYNEMELKYVEGWNTGYEIGLKSQDAWNEGFHECEMICEELLAESNTNCYPSSGSLNELIKEQ